jgi:hypothetical protein
MRLHGKKPLDVRSFLFYAPPTLNGDKTRNTEREKRKLGSRGSGVLVKLTVLVSMLVAVPVFGERTRTEFPSVSANQERPAPTAGAKVETLPKVSSYIFEDDPCTIVDCSMGTGLDVLNLCTKKSIGTLYHDKLCRTENWGMSKECRNAINRKCDLYSYEDGLQECMTCTGTGRD